MKISKICIFIFSDSTHFYCNGLEEQLTSSKDYIFIVDLNKRIRGIYMLIQYIQAALEHAKYEIIDDEEPYYGEVPELQGVWASGKSLEECRKNLEEVIDEWIIIRLKKGLSIPSIENFNFETTGELAVAQN
jgi:predicted RNase H-like HicB family nuclease